jgi:hypothetical protein
LGELLDMIAAPSLHLPPAVRPYPIRRPAACAVWVSLALRNRGAGLDAPPPWRGQSVRISDENRKRVSTLSRRPHLCDGPAWARTEPNGGGHLSHRWRLCCTNHVRDSSCESSVIAGLHEQTALPDLQDQELASL